MRKVLLRTGLALGLSVVPALAGAQKALVYCPINLDRAGCDAAVTALSAGTAYPGGVDRGYDGSGETVDLRAVDLFAYTVFVVPSLADDATNQPYAFLRDSLVVDHLRAALIGGIALWSGTPDQGTLNRELKDQLIRNLAGWAGASLAAAHGPGLVALLDLSETEGARYDWLRAITPLQVTSDAELIAYDSVRALSPAASAILGASDTQLAFTSMASFGFATGIPTPGLSLDAVGATGTTQGGQVVLATLQGGNTSTAKIWTDRLDYAPGDTVTLHGSGWAPGELVTIVRHEDPLVEPDSTILVMADGFGNFTETSFAPDEQDVLTRFVMTANGATSGMRAQTTFTDARTINSVTLNGGSSVTVAPGGTITAVMSAATDGSGANARWRSTGWRISTTAPGSVTCVDHPNHDAVGTYTETFTITAPLAAGTYNAYFIAYNDDGCGSGASSTLIKSNSVTVVVPPATTTTVDPATGIFGGTVNLKAKVQFTAGGNIDGGTVEFFLNGVSVGTATSNGGGNAALNGASLGSIPVGTYPTGVTATLAGNGTTWATSTDTDVLTVNPACTPPSVTTQPVAATKTVGESVTFSVVASGTAPLTYQWRKGGSPIGGATSTSYTIPSVVVADAGSYDVVVSNSCLPTATSSAATLTVNKANPTVSVTGGSFGYDGTSKAGSGFAYGNGGIANVLSPAVTLSYAGTGATTYGPSAAAPTNVGTYNVTASFAGNSNYNSANNTASLTITQATPSVSVTGGSSVYTGTPKAGSGFAYGVGGTGDVLTPAVTFSYSGTGATSYGPTSTAPTNVGTYTVTASFAGNPNYTSASNSASLTITQATATVSISGGSFVYNGSPQGGSGFAYGVGGVGDVLVPAATLSYAGTGGTTYDPSATAPTNVGTYTVTVSFAGNANYPSASNSTSLTITQATSTTVVTFEAGPYVHRGTAYTATAQVTGAGGLTQPASVVYSGECTNVTGPDGCTAAATFAGDANHSGSGDSKSITITKATSTTVVTFEAGPYTYRGTAFAATANVTGANGLNSPVSVVYSGDCTNVTSANGCTATATFAADANHDGSSDSKSITITKVTSTTVVTFEAGPYTYRATPFTASANVTGGGGLSQSVAVVYGGDCTNVTSSNGCTATATFAADANHSGSSDSKSITITKATSTTVVTFEAGPYAYRGTAFTATANVTGAGGLNSLVSVVYGGDCDNVTSSNGCTATATFAGDGNHGGSSDNKSITITKADANVVITPFSGPYDGAAHGISGTATGVGEAELSAGLNLGATFTNVPGGTAHWTFTGGANYLDKSGDAAVTITKASSATVVTFEAGPHTYRGTAFTATANVTGAGGLNSPVTVVYSGDCSSVTNANGCTATATFAADANHNGSSDSKSITITKADANVSITPFSGPYDGAAHGIGGTATGLGGADLSVGLNLGATFTNVPGGTAHWTFTGGANYLDKNGDAAVTITKANSTTVVTFEAGPYTYRGTGFTATANVTGAGGLDSPVSVVYSGDCTNVTSPNGCTATATFGGDANHSSSNDNKSVTIAKAASTTTITVVNGTYDGSPHGGIAVVTGAGGLNESVTVNYAGVPPTTYGPNTGAPTDAGSYRLRATFAGDANHLGSQDAQNLTIAKATSTTAISCPVSVTYDSSAQTPCTVAVTGAGGLSLTPMPTYTNNTNAGTATASYTFAGDANHDGSGDSKNFDITKAASVTAITVANATFDGSSHGGTAVVTGPGGLNESVTVNYAGVPPTTYGPVTTAPTDAGTYRLRATFAGDANHLGSQDAQNLTIAKAPSTTLVTFEAGPYTYRGTAFTATANVTGAGVLNSPVSVIYSGDCTNVTSANGCTATATFAGDGNHDGSGDSKSITIAKAPSTTTSTGGTFVYDGLAHPATAVVAGVGAGITQAVTWSDSGSCSTAPTTVAEGTSCTARADYAGDANHDSSFGTAGITITRRPLTVAATGINKGYDGLNTATATLGDDRVSGDAFTETYAGASFLDANVGTNKPVSVIGIAISGTVAANYNLLNTTAATTASIAVRLVTITAAAKTKVYGQADPALTYAITTGSLAPGDTFTGNLTRAPGEIVGSYAILQGAVALSPNYTLSYLGASLAITKAPLSVTVDNKSRQYSDVVVLTGSISGIKSPGGVGSADNITATFSTTATAMSNVATYPISATLVDPDGRLGNYTVTNPPGVLIVTTEDVVANYSGFTLFSTSSTSSSTATLTLQATLRDPTAVPPSPPYDANPGDIRTAQVRFVSRDPGNYGSVLCSVTVPLTLVTPGDTKVATASCNYAVDIGSADDQEYQIGIEVGPASQGGNYQGSDGSDYAVVTVVKPFPGAVSGGGYAVNTASGGSYAGDAGKKTTFGFNVKNNKSGNNLQGHVNIIFRRGGHLYQIKTTSTTSFTELLFGSKAGGTAQIETKANLTDITNPLAPVSLSGGLTLKIGLTDNGEPGSSDTIAFTLLDGGTLLFSSNWNGSKTIEQLLGGGNLQAR